MTPTIFHFNLYCRGTLVHTFVTDCREDFEEVVTYARAVKEPITMDMLPDLKAALNATVRASLPRPRARAKEMSSKLECIPQAFVCIERCDMTLTLQ